MMASVVRPVRDILKAGLRARESIIDHNRCSVPQNVTPALDLMSCLKNIGIITSDLAGMKMSIQIQGLHLTLLDVKDQHLRTKCCRCQKGFAEGIRH
jgi:hypothetical protein